MPQLDFLHYPYASQIFWLLLNFGVIYFALKVYALPKLSSAQSERDELINSTLAQAQKLKQEAEDSRSGAEDIIAKARQESLAHLHKAEKEIEAIKAAAIQELSDYSKEKEAKLSLETEEEKNKSKALIDSSSIEIAKYILENKFGLKVKESELK